MRRVACLLLIASLLTGACGGTATAPIVDRGTGGMAPGPERYRVLRGDTLFSIAFRFGLDYRKLAAANAIPSPYTIYPGQQLLLAEAELPAPAPAPAARPEVAKPPPEPPVGQSTREQTAVTSTTPVPERPAVAPGMAPVARWRWPGTGKLLRRFDFSRHKGVDLGGERGDPVLATAGGRVVYAGTGIAGYGLMLIVRHNEDFLSAYGHNDALLADEGDWVAAGQEIAKMGSSGTDTVRLHFELRRNGRPVDPLSLLPER